MDRNGNGGVDRRQALECMVWGGTGLVWTRSGGIPAAKIIGEAQAAPTGFSFVQISDSHIGFDKPANPNALGTLEEAIAKVGALRTKPAFMIHTGDITHLSKPQQFDDAEQRIARAKLDVHYVPGEQRRQGLPRPLWQALERQKLVFLRSPRCAFRRPQQRLRPEG